jgi:type I restriction enzyme S subunit
VTAHMDQGFPATWKISTLGEVADGFLSGGTPSTKNEAYWNGAVPWITSKWLNSRLDLDAGEKFISEDAVRQSATTVVPRNNLIFATRVGVGKVAVNRLDLVINQDLAGVLIDSERYDIKFLAYQLRSERIQNIVASHKRGATIQGITRDSLKELKLYLPPLPEQRKIGAVLGLVQRAIEQQKRLIALTTELKKALLHKLFTEGLRGEPQKQTEIGPMPESWDTVRLGEVCALGTGTTPPTSRPEYYNGDVPFVKTADIVNNRIKISQTNVSHEAIKDCGLKLYPPGTVLMAMYGQGKTRGQVSLLEIPAATSQNAAAIQPSTEINSEFLWQYLMSRYQLLRDSGALGHISHLNLGYVRDFQIPKPPIVIQCEIAEILRTIDSRLTLIESRNLLVADLFRTLLDQLMTAQIRVHNLDLPELKTLTI